MGPPSGTVKLHEGLLAALLHVLAGVGVRSRTPALLPASRKTTSTKPSPDRIPVHGVGQGGIDGALIHHHHG